MPTIEDILPQLSGVKVMSSVDCKEGFFHLKLDNESSFLTTTETPFGRIRWLRLPFGISPAPELFQYRLHAALSGLTGIYCVADDILCVGQGETEAEAIMQHNKNFRALLDRCREKGIKLNRQKLKLNRRSMIFCGHELTKDGVRPDPRKIEAILQMPPPADKQGVRRLLGMATYLAKFMPNFSEVTAPIRELLHHSNEFCWRPEVHGVVFSRIKEMLTNAPVLAYFDPTKNITVQCDASQSGLGAVLLVDGKPVEYVARSMTSAEQSYAQIEKELLSCCFALERLHTYVYGRHVTLENDHKPLMAIFKKSLSTSPKRLQRMLLRLQHYDVTFVYKPGTEVVIADTLSRAYPPNSAETTKFTEELATLVDTEQQKEIRMFASEATIKRIQAAAEQDDTYQLLKHQILLGWPSDVANVPNGLKEYIPFADELVLSGGLIFKGQRLLVPMDAREDMLDRIHSSHIGINGCIRRAREALFWPGMVKQIKSCIAECSICQAHQSATQKEPLMSHRAPTCPWEKIGVDIFTFRQQDYLVTVDYLSNFFEIDRLPSKRIEDIVYCLKAHFARYGLPIEVCTDNSPFNSEEFKRFANRYDFVHTTSSPHYPQSNGKAEGAVKTAKRLMEKAAEDHADPHLALLAWRNTPAEYLGGPSPSQILMGRRTRTHLPTTDQLLSSAFSATAHSSLLTAKERQAVYYNRHACERPSLAVGDTVRARWNNNDDWRKAEVVKVLPHRSYEVRTDDGSTRRRTSRHVRFSSEPPVVIRDVIDAAPGPAQQTHLSTATPSPADTGVQFRHPTRTMVAVNNRPSSTATTTTTRSGRQIKQPAKYADYVRK